MTQNLEEITLAPPQLTNLEIKLSVEYKITTRKSYLQKITETAETILNKYFEPKSFEKSGKFYEALGVRQFKKILFNGDYMSRFLNKHGIKHKLISNENSAKEAEKYTRINEGSHIAGFAIFALFNAEEMYDNNYHNALITFVENTIINIYPIMTQRYNRARIYDYFEKIKTIQNI